MYNCIYALTSKILEKIVLDYLLFLNVCRSDWQLAGSFFCAIVRKTL